MPKQKTHRGAAKRFKITAGGKVLRRKATKNHMLSKKTTKQKRGLRGDAPVAPGFAKQIKAII